MSSNEHIPVAILPTRTTKQPTKSEQHSSFILLTNEPPSAVVMLSLAGSNPLLDQHTTLKVLMKRLVGCRF